jgi:hypothetical protein
MGKMKEERPSPNKHFWKKGYTMKKFFDYCISGVESYLAVSIVKIVIIFLMSTAIISSATTLFSASVAECPSPIVELTLVKLKLDKCSSYVYGLLGEGVNLRMELALVAAELEKYEDSFNVCKQETLVKE